MYTKLQKEFEQVMRMSDYDSAKKLSQEIEKLKLEDNQLLERRRRETLEKLVSSFKEKQAKDMLHFKATQEYELIQLQNKWQDKLEGERRKIS